MVAGVDIASILAIGGPTGIIGAVITLLVKSYFDARKDKREHMAAEIQSESGIVDNAKKVIELVRSETERMETRILKLTERAETAEEKNRQLETLINKHEDTIARQARELEWLREDLAKARAAIDDLRSRYGPA